MQNMRFQSMRTEKISSVSAGIREKRPGRNEMKPGTFSLSKSGFPAITAILAAATKRMNAVYRTLLYTG
jgi:hypothetical protein